MTNYLDVNRITLTDNTDMPIIDIKDFTGVYSNADVEDIPESMLTELKNLRPYHGRLIKTHGLGVKISAVSPEILDNLTTFINRNIAGNGLSGSIYIGVYVNNSSYAVSLYGYNLSGTQWSTLTSLGDFTINGTYYHANAKNPIFTYNESLRLLPGNVSKADGSNESKGIILVYVDKTYFDGIYTPTSIVNDYDVEPIKPDFDIYLTNENPFIDSGSADGTDYYYRFSYIYDGNQESLLSDIVYYWDVSAADKMLEIQVRLKTSTITPNHRITGMKVYRSSSVGDSFSLLTYVDFLRPAIDVPSSGSGAYFSNIGGSTKVCIPELTTYSFNAGYEYFISTDGGTTKYPITNPGAGTGSTVFTWKTAILTGSGIAFNNVNPDTITDIGNGFVNAAFNKGDSITITNGSNDGSTFTIETVVAGTLTLVSTDAVVAEGAGASRTITALSHRYKATISADTISFTDADPDTITDTGNGFVTAGFEIGDTITVSGDSDNNGEYIIATVAVGTLTLTDAADLSTEGVGDAVRIDALADNWDDSWALYDDNTGIGSTLTSASTGAYWGNLTIILPTAYTDKSLIGGVFAVSFGMPIDDNFDKAIHVTYMYTTPNNDAYKIARVRNGLYLSLGNSTTVTTRIYDTLAITPSGTPPLEGEKSIKVNGKFAELISGRLWQANIVLDPGGKGEVHEDWASYSELYQPDVNPVSNVRYIPDREGGELTGLTQMFGNPIFLKKQAIVRLDVAIAPGTPSSWKITESPHNIGNIAPDGYIAVLGDVYIVYYDGIYRIKPVNTSDTDSTPTENLRISEPIADTFDNMTNAEKVLVRVQYDQDLNEILYVFPLSAGDEIWAYNINSEQWREIETSRTVNENSLLVLDEVADVMVYDATDKKVYSLAVEEDVDIEFQTKTFPIAFKRSQLVKYLTVRYKSDETITLDIYSDIVFSEGDLVNAKTYRIHDNSGGLDMTNIGAANNNVGTDFTCAGGTTPTTWGTGSIVQTSPIATKTLPVHHEAHNETIYIGRYVKEFKLKFSTS